MKLNREVWAEVWCTDRRCAFEREGENVRIVKDAARFHVEYHGHMVRGVVKEEVEWKPK